MVGRLAAPAARGHAAADAAHTNGNLPPPSTLAAQIVRNHAGTEKGAQQADASATFGELLQEILNSSSAPETDVSVNHKLIKVVTEAGLDVLLHDNPFAQWNTLTQRARDSLAVIRSTLERQPEILLLGSEDQAQVTASSPLLLFLPTKLFSVAVHPKCASLQDDVLGLLFCIARALLKSLDLWPHGQTLLNTFQGCVDDLVTTLESSKSKSIDMRLPPGRTISDLWPRSEQTIALPRSYQIHVKTTRDALVLATVLLEVIRSVFDGSHYSVQTRNMLFLHTWSLSMVLRLQRVFWDQRAWYEPHDSFDSVCIQVFRMSGSIASIAERTKHLESLSITCRAAAGAVVEHSRKPLSPDFQEEISNRIDRLLNIPYSNSGLEIASELLTPAVQVLACNQPVYSTSTTDLRRSIVSWLAKFSPAVTQPSWVTFTVAETDGDVSMTDANQQRVQQAESTSALALPTHNPLKRKRRQVVSNRSADIHKQTYSELRKRITALLGKDQGGDTVSLHQVARYVCT